MKMLNKKVLSSQRKVRNDEAVRRDTGRVFHARTAATGNARSPRLDRYGTPSVAQRHHTMLSSTTNRWYGHNVQSKDERLENLVPETCV